MVRKTQRVLFETVTGVKIQRIYQVTIHSALNGRDVEDEAICELSVTNCPWLNKFDIDLRFEQELEQYLSSLGLEL